MNAQVLQRIAIVLLLTLIVCCTSPPQAEIAQSGRPMTLTYEAGVSSLPTTYSKFLAAAARVTRDRDGDGQIDQWMLTIDYFPIWYKQLRIKRSPIISSAIQSWSNSPRG